jgi:hypothetical protein
MDTGNIIFIDPAGMQGGVQSSKIAFSRPASVGNNYVVE